MSLEEKVREQGEKVRRLKADKAPKEEVSCENKSFYMGSIVNGGSGGIQQLSILHIFWWWTAEVHFCYCNIAIGQILIFMGGFFRVIDCFSGLTNLPNLPWNTGPAGPPLP